MNFVVLYCILLPLVSCQRPIKGASLAFPSWTWGQKLYTANEVANDRSSHAQKIQPRPFLPFSDLGASAGPKSRKDGTTKSRTTQDTLPIGHLTNGLEEGFTTLDVLQKETQKSGRGNRLPIKGSLGGLHPDEVFYADDDLIIVKGGGFKAPTTYTEPPQDIDDRDNTQTRWSVSHKLPSPSEEYNGNIATIVAPPSYSQYNKRHQSAASQFMALSLFLPADVLGSESQRHYSVEPSQQLTVQPQSTMTMLPQNLLHPNLNYLSGPYIRNQNTRIYPNVGYITYRTVPPVKKNNFPPRYQIAAVDSGVRTVSQFQPWQSLKDDTKVNYMDPKPDINQYAEVIFKETYHPQRIPSHRYQTASIKSSPEAITNLQPWRSLEDDTKVNYLDPKPEINPDAEYIPETRNFQPFTEFSGEIFYSGVPRYRPRRVHIKRVARPSV